MSALIVSTTSKSSRQDTSEKVWRQLLEFVQECQKRYGGKTELATEFDSCVAGLCVALEAVFVHGLRHHNKNIPSTLKQVSEIVANSLHINTENTASFWQFVEYHLTKHERERYAILKHIWTDSGRCKAWIRSSLNERSLERYFHILLNNEEVLANYYEEWALLRDEEKSSLLPNMAAGLGSILFAIRINKPELNSGIPYRSEVLKSKVEPIIEAPIKTVSEPNKDKKKRKVARQFISFDGEDTSSILSTSAPSSSSSISSETNSTSSGDHQVPKLKQICEDKMESTSQITRKLSVENSGARSKFVSDVPEKLTPVSHKEIGELTAVSVEINKTNSPISDELVEMPTDISAVLTAVESKNNEELLRKQEKIDLLSKENESLKEQVKKYISAIQMLQQNSDGKTDVSLDGIPDYKGEAKLFERKLVQVAEMHAELMDFNVSLQQNLSQKDVLLERLKSELEQLRGPISDEVLDLGEGQNNVNVWIPSAFLTGSGSNAHHVYQIFLRAGNDEWNIYRRYAQFYALHSDLKKLDPEVGSFDFPPKKSIGNKDSTLVEDRRKRLQVYLRRILNHWPELSFCNSRFLLEQHLNFFKDERDDNKQKKSMFSPRRNQETTSDNHYTGL